jgi:hypothetical protein
MPKSNEVIHTTQHHCFRTRALPEPSAEKVVPQIEVGLNPHIGLTQDHKRYHVQDP